MILLASLIGDSIILIATTKYKAIKLHKVIITVMQHMAVCDLMQAVLAVFPVTLGLITDRWVMGELLCHVQYNIRWVCAPVAVFLTSAMTTLKLIIVKYPLRTGAWSTWLGHKVCSSLWLLVIACYTPLNVVNLLYIRDTIYFSYTDYGCAYDYLSPTLPSWFLWYTPTSIAVLGTLSFTTLIVTSVILLIVARSAASRHGETLRWEGVITILLTAIVLLFSYLPYSVVTVAWFLGIELNDSTFRALFHLINLNIMANFFVYSLTVRSFRNFLKIKISELLSLMSTRGGRQTHQRPQPHQRRQRPYQRQVPNLRQDPPQVQSGDTLTPVAELQGLQLQGDGIQHHSTNIVDTPV